VKLSPEYCQIITLAPLTLDRAKVSTAAAAAAAAATTTPTLSRDLQVFTACTRGTSVQVVSRHLYADRVVLVYIVVGEVTYSFASAGTLTSSKARNVSPPM